MPLPMAHWQLQPWTMTSNRPSRAKRRRSPVMTFIGGAGQAELISGGRARHRTASHVCPLVEQLVPEGLLLLMPVVVIPIAPVVARTLEGPTLSVIVVKPVGSFDDLVQLPAVEPDAAALRAVVDLHALPVRHHQGHTALRTIHRSLLWLRRRTNSSLR